MKFHKVKCPVVWDCLAMGETVTVEPHAVYNVKEGWVCICGNNVTGEDTLHEVKLTGIREGCELEPDDDLGVLFENKKTVSTCCECGAVTDRCILGVFICKDCYSYDFKNDSPPMLGLAILNCSIDFNPRLNICKNCERFKDCSKHYVVIKGAEIRKDQSLFQSP